MRMLVFGGTGGVGRRVVVRALADGHEVTAFVRRPERLTVDDPRLRVVVGDVLDAEAVSACVDQAQPDAVVSALGTRELGPSTLLTEGMGNIVGALAEVGPQVRLVVVSSVGAGGSAGQLPLLVRVPLMRMLRNAIADHDGQEAQVRASDAQWTIVRCVGLTDRPGTGSPRVVLDGPVKGTSISRDDVAAFLVKVAEDGSYVRRAVALAG